MRTFEWDGANRLVTINYTGTANRSELSYDGLSRLVKIVEKTGSTINSTNKFVWRGTQRCEIRNANGGVTLRMYGQGQFDSGTAYFYSREHLGSVRENGGLNLFGYVGNNPGRKIDSLGLIAMALLTRQLGHSTALAGSARKRTNWGRSITLMSMSQTD